ncbi:conserved protein of unknown function [Tenacibaculum sp. 190130A14a]|uniref:Cxxc_20_cxxc protein n=1 Tax=Tenacibaculum polynesiense TaxID=3137857 RepID=A0ABM9PCK8_9FLAO
MRLYTRCKSCKSEFKIKSNAETRPDLQMEKGEEFKVNCLNCGKVDKVHVNDIRAEQNNIIILIGLVFGIITTIVLWYYFGAIGTISAIIPVLFWQTEMKSVKAFNSYLIRRK